MRRSEGQRDGFGAGFLLLILAGVVFAGLRLYGLAEYPLDGDEIYSFRTSQAPWTTFAAETARDAIHPPLFYLLLHGWIVLGGDGLWWIRLLPALAAIGCIVPLVLLARTWRLGWGPAAAAVLLLALNPTAIYYAQHLRMYSLLMLLAMVALWLLAGWIEDPERRWLMALTAVNLAMVYTQYYGWVAVGIEGLAVLLWRRDRLVPFAGATALVAVGFAPWAWVAARSLEKKGGLGQNLGWVPKPVWDDFTWFFAQLMSWTEVPYAGHYATALVVVLILIALTRPDRRLGILLLFAILPAAIAFAASLALPESIWGQRHLLMSAGPLYLACTMAVWMVSRERLRGILVGALCLGAITGLAADFAMADRKLRWNLPAARILESPPSAIYAFDGYPAYPLEFHLDDARYPVSETTPEAVTGAGWAIYSRGIWDPDPEWSRTLTGRGCQTGEELRIQDRFREVVLFPVSCGL